MTKERANKIYDVLVQMAGAVEPDRFSFVLDHTGDDPASEWRFCGKFGFGGKYRSWKNMITMYPEDETPKLAKLRSEVNAALALIK